jgi:hypothetical protein
VGGTDVVKISKETLAEQAQSGGFRPDMLEKVAHLLALLESINVHPVLKGKFALKGGTALNLFVFYVPRLSVDIDLNFVPRGGAPRLPPAPSSFKRGLVAWSRLPSFGKSTLKQKP